MNPNPPSWRGWGPAVGAVVCIGLIASVIPLFGGGTCSRQQIQVDPRAEARTSDGEYDMAIGIAFDLSGSVDPDERRSAAQFMMQVCKASIRDRLHIRVWEYAESCDESGDFVVERSQDFVQEVERLIPEKKGTFGTKQVLPLNQMKAFVQSGDAHAKTIVLVLLTDGETHDAPQELSRAIDELASDQRIAAILVGPLLNENREKYRQLFRPFGERFVLFGPSSGDKRRAQEDLERLLRR